MRIRVIPILLVGLISVGNLFSQIPAGYYDNADGKTKDSLKSVLHRMIRTSVSADYDAFSAQYWGDVYFKKTDWNPSGYYWDMYSTSQLSVYNNTAFAREHCMPRSWWGTTSSYGTANSDLFNLYPANSAANSKKTNLPLGVAASDAWTNNVVKVGLNTYPGSPASNCFEPADEYKGDFARTYLYMVTCYQDYASRWRDEALTTMLNNETYPVFQPWALQMLLDWCRTDPVSSKEIARNDSVFKIQQNRNPFIDIPLLYEYIWGDSIAKPLPVVKATTKQMLTPTNGLAVNFGEIRQFTNRSRTIPVKGVLLTDSTHIVLRSGNANQFALNVNALSANEVNADGGYSLIVTYNPQLAGTHTAELLVANSGDTLHVNLVGKAFSGVWNDPVVPENDEDVILFYTGPWEKRNLPATFNTNVASAPYANGDFSFRKTAEYLTVSFDEEAAYMQFAIYPRNDWGNNNNHIYVYEGVNKESISSTPIADFDNTFVTIETYNNTPKIALQPTTRAIKIEYIKVAQNVGINNLIIMRRGSSSPVVEREFTKRNVKVSLSDNVLLVFGMEPNETFRIYDVFGRLLHQQITTDGAIQMYFPYKGMFILQNVNTAVKFISK